MLKGWFNTLPQKDRTNIMITLVTMGCGLMFMVSRRLSDSQNFLLLETIRVLAKVSSLERIALEVTNKLAEMDERDLYSIIEFFGQQSGNLKKNERYQVAYLCLRVGVLDDDTRMMVVCGHIFRELGIKEPVFDDMLEKALGEIRAHNILGYSEEHKDVKPILDEALKRTQPIALP